MLANRLSEVTRIAGYLASMTHIVVRKEKRPWLVSIANWGIRVGWFSDKASALERNKLLSADYDADYGFGAALGSGSPQVQIIEFSAQNFLSDLRAAVAKAGVELRCGSFQGRVAEVPQSAPDREKVVTLSDVPDSMKRRRGSSHD